jgi:hypothetical protein
MLKSEMHSRYVSACRGVVDAEKGSRRSSRWLTVVIVR